MKMKRRLFNLPVGPELELGPELPIRLTAPFWGDSVPFTTQNRLVFEVTLPLWYRRGPAPRATAGLARPPLTPSTSPSDTEASKEEACDRCGQRNQKSVWE